MHGKAITLGTSPVRNVEGLHFALRGTPATGKLVAVAVGVVILAALLV